MEPFIASFALNPILILCPHIASWANTIIVLVI